MTITSNILNVFTGIGALLFSYVVARGVDNLLWHVLSPSKPLERYRVIGSQPTYALITGGNGGIGYGTAQALLQRGFGVILLGRNAAKLDAAAEELRNSLTKSVEQRTSRELVRTIILDPQVATGEEIQQAIQECILEPDLQVSILVNNVGSVPIAHPPYREHATYSTSDIDGTIDLNARFMAHLTAQMVPILAKIRTRALILNLSSGANVGVPYQVMYSATKGFTSSFSLALSRELEADQNTKHIDVLNVLCGDVHSQNNVAGLTKGSPDSTTYGRCIVEKTDGAVYRGWREMSPFWGHHLNFIMLAVTPDSLVTKGVLDIMLMKKAVMNEAMKPKGP